MNWHVICRVGNGDEFVPEANPSPRLLVVFDESSRSPQVKNDVVNLIRGNGLEISEDIVDLLHMAMCVYTADLRIDRAFATDKWTRHISVHLPVAKLAAWEAVGSTITDMLGFLTGDIWTFNFRQRAIRKRPALEKVLDKPPSLVTLFSGGLDSFVGAIDLLEETKDDLALVGQHGRGGSINPSQRNSRNVLSAAYPGRTFLYGFFVQPTKPGDRAYENTMRARSILFLALGTAVANACGDKVPLIVSENGLISLNVPLSNARTGSLSTRTTHPYFISLFRVLLDKLGLQVPIKLPYKFMTKGEMLAQAKNQDVLRKGLPVTLSCARPDAGRFQKRPPGTHCGYCVPCIIRLSSMKAAGFSIRNAAYFDVATDKADPSSTKGSDRRAFELAIERTKSLSPLRLAGEVLQSGRIPPEDIHEYAGVYKRGLDEVAVLLKMKSVKK